MTDTENKYNSGTGKNNDQAFDKDRSFYNEQMTKDRPGAFSPDTPIDRILSKVSNAVETRDFSHLSSDIGTEVRKIRDNLTRLQKSVQNTQVTHATNKTEEDRRNTVRQQENRSFEHSNDRPEYGFRSMLRRLRPVHRTAFTTHKQNNVLTWIGAITLGIFFIAFFTALADQLSYDSTGLADILPLAFFSGISGFFTVLCIRRLRLNKFFQHYAPIVGESEFIDIRDLAVAAMESEDKTRKRVKKMIRSGYLKGAILDDQEKTLILTDKAYRYYRQAQDAAYARERRTEYTASETTSEASSDRAAKDSSGQEQGVSAPSETEKLYAEGNRFILEIRNINDEIPDPRMSEKLYKLEEIVNRIFERAKQNPDSVNVLRKFMSYYVPTTRKLLHAYLELDRQPQVGENIQKTKKEIEAAVDSINSAYENLLDDLFYDVAMDISSDISVMKAMIAQDGLADVAGMGGKNKEADLDFGQHVFVKEKVPAAAGENIRKQKLKHMEEPENG